MELIDVADLLPTCHITIWATGDPLFPFLSSAAGHTMLTMEISKRTLGIGHVESLSTHLSKKGISH